MMVKNIPFMGNKLPLNRGLVDGMEKRGDKTDVF
jgi:hypothetical protein